MKDKTKDKAKLILVYQALLDFGLKPEVIINRMISMSGLKHDQIVELVKRFEKE